MAINIPTQALQRFVCTYGCAWKLRYTLQNNNFNRKNMENYEKISEGHDKPSNLQIFPICSFSHKALFHQWISRNKTSADSSSVATFSMCQPQDTLGSSERRHTSGGMGRQEHIVVLLTVVATRQFPRCEPWCWKICQHKKPKFMAQCHVGKYSSTMGCIWVS